MGGIDNSDMLVHLYRIPMKSKRWYMQMFANAVDVSLTNAWIMYRWDSKGLPAPLMMSPSLSWDTAATPQMLLSGLTCL